MLRNEVAAGEKICHWKLGESHQKNFGERRCLGALGVRQTEAHCIQIDAVVVDTVLGTRIDELLNSVKDGDVIKVRGNELFDLRL